MLAALDLQSVPPSRWKVRDGEDIIASTRDARAPQNLRPTRPPLQKNASTPPIHSTSLRAGLVATETLRSYIGYRLRDLYDLCGESW